MEAGGEYQAAFDLFYSLSSYRDAASRAQVLADRLGIKIKTVDDPF